MTTYDAMAALVAGGFVVAACLLRRRCPRHAQGRFARFVLWLGVAAPLPFLLLAPSDRFRLLVRGADGTFEGFELLAFAAAAVGLVLTLLPRFRSWWANALLIGAGALLALSTAVLHVR